MRTVVRRLEKEISQLGQRANVNLLIGSIIAGVGIIALGYALWGEPILNSDVDDWQDKVLKLGARASFVLLIEFFAFFFLRLYSNTLGEIKYFQNELTNFQSKALAIRTSLSLTAPVSLEALLGELSKTERNFVLRKGESTVELRQAEIEQNGVSQMSKLLNQLLKGIGPAKG